MKITSSIFVKSLKMTTSFFAVILSNTSPVGGDGMCYLFLLHKSAMHHGTIPLYM